MARPGAGLILAGAIVAFSGLCIVLVDVFQIPPWGVLLVVGVGLMALGLIRRYTSTDPPNR